MIILCGQTKGGVGKSVLAANLTVALAHQGRNVLLLDADKQQSSSKWGSVRTIEGHKPEIVVASSLVEDDAGKEFRAKILALKDRFDDIVIDCGGHDSRELRASIVVADLLIAPVAPSIVDLWALSDFDNDVLGLFMPANPDLKALVVINKAPSLNFYNQIGQAREAFDQLNNLAFSGVVITDRPRVQDCYQAGQGILDLEPKNDSIRKAQDEFNNLYHLVKNHDK
jgi:chromosome partitioning protein